METRSIPEQENLEERKTKLLAEIESNRKIYDSYDVIPKDQFSNSEDVEKWNEVAKKLESLHFELAQVDKELQKRKEENS